MRFVSWEAEERQNIEWEGLGSQRNNDLDEAYVSYRTYNFLARSESRMLPSVSTTLSGQHFSYAVSFLFFSSVLRFRDT